MVQAAQAVKFEQEKSMERDSKASQGAMLSEAGEQSFSPHTSLTMDSITSEDVRGLSPRHTSQFKNN